MNTFLARHHKTIAMVTLAAFSACASTPAFGDSVIKLNSNFKGTIDAATEGPSEFTLQGTATHLGKFTAYGEVQLPDGNPEGQTAQGVVVFTAANGDQLVGITTWVLGAEQLGQMSFSWRDSVEFSDGTIVASTGRFEHDRPPGLVVIAIIAILIGLLLPAVQKVR